MPVQNFMASIIYATSLSKNNNSFCADMQCFHYQQDSCSNTASTRVVWGWGVIIFFFVLKIGNEERDSNI